MTKLSIIAAVQRKDRALGRNNGLLWHIPEDLKRFKAITSGHPVIMGMKTYQSIGRPLPNRTNIVISDVAGFEAPGCVVCHSLDEALRAGREHDQNEVFIIGGGFVYKQTLPLADRLYLTVVESNEPADVYFPEYESLFTKLIFKEDHLDAAPPFSFLILEK